MAPPTPSLLPFTFLGDVVRSSSGGGATYPFRVSSPPRKRTRRKPHPRRVCLSVLMLIVLASLGLIRRHRPIDAENSANTSTGTVQFQYWALMGAHTGIGTAVMAFISSMGHCAHVHDLLIWQ